MKPARRALVGALVRASLALLLACALPLHALADTLSGSGRMASETRSLPDFQAIALAGAMDLDLRQGATQSVQVQTDDELLPLLESVVEEGRHGATLKLRWRQGSAARPSERVRVRVVVPRLRALAAAGSGDLRVEAFSTPQLDVRLSGSGVARLSGLRADELGLTLAGSSTVHASGSATRLRVAIAGSGEVRLAELAADEVSLRIAGSGQADVAAHKTLDVRIAGSGDVRYSGDAEVKLSRVGSGQLTRR